MANAIQIHDEAKRELDVAAERIAADRERAAQEFLDAVRRDLEVVREYPLAGKQIRRSRLRQFVIDGWRHSIIYAQSRMRSSSCLPSPTTAEGPDTGETACLLECFAS